MLALKQLLDQNRQAFEREVSALKVFNGFAHPHVVRLLMTWTYQGKFFLLFPFAECDLGKYWESEPSPKVDKGAIRWMSKQLLGIAGALASIHDPASTHSPSDNLRVPDDEDQYGRHGDLKPENILFYNLKGEEKGTLVIADMGLSRLHTMLSRSNQSNNKVPATPRYKPPECDIEGARIARSYDIWTFGCLVLEWVCWLFGGQSARESFLVNLLEVYPPGTRKDMFYSMKAGGTKEYRVEMKAEVIRVGGHV